MKKVKIQIIKIGTQRHDELFKRLESYNTKLFQISIKQVSRPKCDFGWGFEFQTLSNILKPSFNNDENDLCIGFIDTSIEKNYFSKRLSEKNDLYIVSFFEIDKILLSNNIDLFNYILLTVYRCLIRFKFNRKPNAHHETKGCLFDMCGMKEDIIYSCANPTLCIECKSSLNDQEQFLNDLISELPKIRKSIYYQIKDFIEIHPWYSLFIGIFFTIFLNIISSLIYEYIKNIFQ